MRNFLLILVAALALSLSAAPIASAHRPYGRAVSRAQGISLGYGQCGLGGWSCAGVFNRNETATAHGWAVTVYVSESRLPFPFIRYQYRTRCKTFLLIHGGLAAQSHFFAC